MELKNDLGRLVDAFLVATGLTEKDFGFYTGTPQPVVSMFRRNERVVSAKRAVTMLSFMRSYVRNQKLDFPILDEYSDIPDVHEQGANKFVKTGRYNVGALLESFCQAEPEITQREIGYFTGINTENVSRLLNSSRMSGKDTAQKILHFIKAANSSFKIPDEFSNIVLDNCKISDIRRRLTEGEIPPRGPGFRRKSRQKEINL